MPPRLSLLLLFLSFFSLYRSTSLTDTITPHRPLKDGQVLTSGEHNNFALGFFTPGNSTRHRYLGVWYNKVSVFTVIWVANRDQPINGSDGILSIAKDGNLVLSSHNSTVWSTNISYTVKGAPNAQLLDSGNLLLLIDGDGGSQKVAWQSFDYPTNALLPGMKHGFDRRTGLRRILNSWRSVNDPGHGSYSYQLIPTGGSVEMFLYRDGSVPVWRSGPWDGQRFNGIPEMARSSFVDYNVVDNPDEVYSIFSLNNTSVFLMVVVDGESGTIRQLIWQEDIIPQWMKTFDAPQQDCDYYGSCGAFSLCNPNVNYLLKCTCFPGYQPKSLRQWYPRATPNGCDRARNVSMCSNGEGFLKLENVKLPDTSRAKSNLSMSLEECREECLKNCSCLAFTKARMSDGSSGPSGCMVYHGDLLDTKVYGVGKGQDLYIRVDAVDLAKGLKKSKGHLNKKNLGIISVCVTMAFMALATLAYWYSKKKRKERRYQEDKSLWPEAEESDSITDLPGIFHLSTIVAATDNFNPTNKLGEGGFGIVYKGKLSSGQEIAVKRLSDNSRQGTNEFKSEVRLIAKLQHKNLVKTLGCCVKGQEKMLIYEFLPNKSLDKYIFDEEKKTLLDWTKRHNIIIGIAKGVLYLHQDSRLKIIHRDLKAGNILLDATMTPKISDFGLARIFGHDQIEANTDRVVGTYGYMSPEYAMKGHFSIKSDVFSFGVILLEIISGKKSNRYYNDNLYANLIGYVWKMWQAGSALHIVDESILPTTSGYEDEVLRCIHVGLLCVQENPNERPTMLEVIVMLINNKSELPSHKPIYTIEGNHHNNEAPMSSSNGIHSVNELTTTVEAR